MGLQWWHSPCGRSEHCTTLRGAIHTVARLELCSAVALS